MANVVTDGAMFVATDNYNLYVSADGKTWDTV